MTKTKISDAFFAVSLTAMTAGLVIWPAQAVKAASDALALCLNIVIPSLFSFFVVSNLIVSMGYAGYFGRWLSRLTGPLFGLGGQCGAVFALGLIGGYPVGARTAAVMYRAGACTKKQAEHMLAFCSNCGPAFILGTVGAGVFSSAAAGAVLYAAHLLSAVIVGIMFRQDTGEDDTAAPIQKAESFPSAFVDSVKKAVLSGLNVAGFIVFFSVLLSLLDRCRVLSFLSGGNPWILRLLTGFFEISNGVMSLRGAGGRAAMTAAGFMLGWGGLCVHLQTLSELEGTGLSVKNYFLGKALHGLTAAALTFILSSITDVYPLSADNAIAIFSPMLMIPGPVIAAGAFLCAAGSARLSGLLRRK